MYSYFEEVLGVRNRRMVNDLPLPYVFMLLPCKAKDCPHPRCQENGNSDDGNTWFPGGPPLSYFPIPIADPKRPWGEGGCFQTAWRQMHWTLSPGAFCSQKNNSCTSCVPMFHSWLFQNLTVSTPWIFAIEQQKKRTGSQRESWGMLLLQRDPTTNQAERTCFIALPAATSSFGMM